MLSIEDQIDALYQLPPGSFTAARNALAKTLKGDDAQRVKALPKAAPVPWAVNQLYWRARRTYDRLMQAGARLRKAQIAALGGAARDLQSLTSTHRAAIADAVAETGRIAQQAGSRLEVDVLGRMLEALSLSADPPARPGRLTAVVQPAGFEALAGVVAVGPTHAESVDADLPRRQSVVSGSRTSAATVTTGTARTQAGLDGLDRVNAERAEREEAARREKRYTAARSQAEAAVRTLTHAAETARVEEDGATQALAQAHEATVRAERELREAQSRLRAIERTSQR